jgi:membrane fusion protein (multidrug efflux system)
VKRLLLPAAIMVGAVAAAAFGAHWLLVGRFLESTNDAYLKADPSVIAPRVSGYVAEVLVAANQDVQAGQVLVRIEDATYRAMVAKRQAELGSAEAEIAKLQAQIAFQKSMLEQAQAAETVAEAKAAYAGREGDRFGKLAESGAVSRQQVDQSRTQSDQANAELANARAAVTSATRTIDVLQAQIAEGESARDAARAELQAANLDLEATKLTSRIAGRIGDKTVNVGEYVVAGTRLMSVMPVNDIYLEANYKETQVGRIRVGQPATIRVDALPGVDVPGRVDSLSPGTGAQFALLPPENATGNFTKIVQRVPVRVRVDADAATKALLLPGLSVTVTIDTRGDGGH